MSEVLVVIDHADGEVKKPTYELLTIARRLGEPSAVFIGGAFALGVLGARFLRSSRQNMGLDTGTGYRRSSFEDGFDDGMDRFQMRAAGIAMPRMAPACEDRKSDLAPVDGCVRTSRWRTAVARSDAFRR